MVHESELENAQACAREWAYKHELLQEKHDLLQKNYEQCRQIVLAVGEYYACRYDTDRHNNFLEAVDACINEYIVNCPSEQRKLDE